MELVSPVVVEDDAEGERISVKIHLILVQRVGVDQLDDGRVIPGLQDDGLTSFSLRLLLISNVANLLDVFTNLGEHAQPGERPPLEEAPHDLVPHPPHVDEDARVPPSVSLNGRAGRLGRVLVVLIAVVRRVEPPGLDSFVLCCK